MQERKLKVSTSKASITIVSTPFQSQNNSCCQTDLEILERKTFGSQRIMHRYNYRS